MRESIAAIPRFCFECWSFDRRLFLHRCGDGRCHFFPLSSVEFFHSRGNLISIVSVVQPSVFKVAGA